MKNGFSASPTKSQSQLARSMDFVAHRHQRAAHDHAGHDLARQRAGGDARRRLARRGAAAAAIVAHAVFHVIGVVGMAGPVLPGDLAIVLGALVDILDHHRDRRAGGDHGLAVVVHDDAGKNSHLVRLAALGDEARLAGLALVEFGLDIGLREADAGRAAVDDAAERRPVAFAPGRDAEEMSERVVRHRIQPRPAMRAGSSVPSIGVFCGGQTVTRRDLVLTHSRCFCTLRSHELCPLAPSEWRTGKRGRPCVPLLAPLPPR